MREIKFRAWDKINKFMFYPEYIGTNDKNCFPDTRREASEFELMQFTGLADTRVQPIYEGDILRVKLNKDKIEDLTVIYEFGAFHAGPHYLVIDVIHEATIIGHIYQNDNPSNTGLFNDIEELKLKIVKLEEIVNNLKSKSMYNEGN